MWGDKDIAPYGMLSADLVGRADPGPPWGVADELRRWHIRGAMPSPYETAFLPILKMISPAYPRELT